MEAPNNNELDYYISKLGLTTEREKKEFSCLFNYVLKTPLPHDEQNLEQLIKFNTLSTLSFPSEIIGFQTVLRKHFQQSVYIDLSAGFPEAEAEFQNCVERKQFNYGRVTTDQLALYGLSIIEVERARSQMTTQKKWIREVNELRRDSFQKRAAGEGELSFKIQLSNHFPLEPVITCYEEQEIVQFSDALKAKTVAEFLARFPSFEEKNKEHDELASWAANLGKAIAALINQTLEQNKKNRETWERVISDLVSDYKRTMATFLEKHPLVEEQRLRLSHDTAKAKADLYLPKMLLCNKHTDLLGSALNAAISKEFSIFEAEWKRGRERRIAAFLSAVGADAEKRYRGLFKSDTTEPGDDGLNQLISQQVAEAVARDLDRAADGFCGCLEEDFHL